MCFDACFVTIFLILELMNFLNNYYYYKIFLCACVKFNDFHFCLNLRN